MSSRSYIRKIVRRSNNTITGDQTWSGTEVHSGTETHSGTESHAGAITHTGNVTINRPGQLTEFDYDPALRVWARSDFGKKVYTKTVASDWSVFKSVASADLEWFISGNATTYGGKASSDGGTVLSGSNNSKMVFMKPSTGSRFRKIMWNTSKRPRFRCVIKTGSSLANLMLKVGLYSSAGGKAISGAPYSNRAEFTFTSATDSRFHCRVGGATSTSATAAGVVATGTVYDLDIRVDSSRIATFYINGTLVATASVALASAKNLVPVIGFRSGSTQKRNIGVYHIACSRDI